MRVRQQYPNRFSLDKRRPGATSVSITLRVHRPDYRSSGRHPVIISKSARAPRRVATPVPRFGLGSACESKNRICPSARSDPRAKPARARVAAPPSGLGSPQNRQRHEGASCFLPRASIVPAKGRDPALGARRFKSRSVSCPSGTDSRGTASGVRCGARAHSSPATLLGGRIQGGPTIFADAAFVLYSGAL